MATCSPLPVPRQISPIPPESMAMSLFFSSAAENMAEAGSRPVAPHTSPKAVMNFALCGSMPGYTFAHRTGQGRVQEWKIIRHRPDQPCLQISPDLPVSVPERFEAVPCHLATGEPVASTFRMTSRYPKTPGLRPPHGSNREVQ